MHQLVQIAAERTQSDEYKIDVFLNRFLLLLLRPKKDFLQSTPQATFPNPHLNLKHDFSLSSETISHRQDYTNSPIDSFTQPTGQDSSIGTSHSSSAHQHDPNPNCLLSVPTTVISQLKQENLVSEALSQLQPVHDDKEKFKATPGPDQHTTIQDAHDQNHSRAHHLPQPDAQSQSLSPFQLLAVTLQEREDSLRNIFYGDTSFYLMFRYYQILYDRLSKAKELDNLSVSLQKFQDRFSTPPSEPSHRSKYEIFFELASNFQAGALDQQKYEDECREIFGMSSYLFFTLHKIVELLTKQISKIISSQSCLKQLEIYASGHNELIYQKEAALVIEQGKRFQIEFDQDARILGIRFIDLDSSTSEAPEKPHKSPETFLWRNKKRNDPLPAKDQLQSFNGLEWKVIDNGKVIYVGNSEDYFYRRDQLYRARLYLEKKKQFGDEK
eukprot:TRINITY_DN1443_c0_g1_i1.p1 TRINITY_DN1443_c0_g1~~TRINITY_DN1443_c0_g1_i1.p1  ORF type:complete len:441 (+),score=75.64 TRINITY_DN1443_c0_g1_i1:711-2033(+)